VRLWFKVSIGYMENWIGAKVLIKSTSQKIARIESMIEGYHTLLKQYNCNLNKWVLCKIGLSRYGLDQDVV
jgi:hypothetical protein